MNFNPFEHMNELVFSNVFVSIFPGPVPTTVTAPDGTVIPASVQGHPETVTYWLPTNGDGVYHQITAAQALAEQLWLHAAYGVTMWNPNAPILQDLGLAYQVHVTDQQLHDAVYSTPALLARLDSAGVTEQQAVAYAHAEAPDIMLVGQP